jgi:hypothetical protein
LRVPVEVPVLCVGAGQHHAKTVDLCEGGMAIQFKGRVKKETSLRFSLDLPGLTAKFEIWGELAWEGDSNRAGVRFKDVTDEQRRTLRDWINSQLPEPVQDDPPVLCRMTDLTMGGCYLTTTSPFPKGACVTLSVRTGSLEVYARGVVRLAHPEFGMGVEFLLTTPEQQDQVRNLIETLRSSGESPELQVVPDGLEEGSGEKSARSVTQPALDDPLVDLFRHQSDLAVDVFLHQMQQQRQLQST